MPYKDPEKQKAAQRSSYERTRVKHLERSNLSRNERKKWIDSLKAGKSCTDCNGLFPPYVLDFHHRDSSTKIMSIANAVINRSKAFVEEELLKCDLTCANCHRIRTHGDNARFVDPNFGI